MKRNKEEIKIDVEDPKQTEVIYKFYLPDNRDELEVYMKAPDFLSALCNIYNECRHVWKYEEEASEEKVSFAEKIGEIASSAGILDIP